MQAFFFQVTYTTRFFITVRMASGSDFAVQATCNDASMCKRYAVQKGYWSDPFITHMVKSAGSKKAPEINRGYYARTESVWQLVKKFISATNRNCQVVSLGAGLDTTYWRLQEANIAPVRYVEIDFSAITTKKSQAIQSKPLLLNVLKNNDNLVEFEGGSIISNRYCLLPCDLRELEGLKAQLNCANIDFSLSTLFISECVLVYIPSEKSNNIIRWIAEAFSDCMFVNYEQVNMNDKFGQVMIQNLSNRECDLPGVDMCISVETQRHRFLDSGWQKVECITMWSAYSFLPQSDVQRIEKLEFLDEIELLEQLLSHYCISWANKITSQSCLLQVEL